MPKLLLPQRTGKSACVHDRSSLHALLLNSAASMSAAALPSLLESPRQGQWVSGWLESGVRRRGCRLTLDAYLRLGFVTTASPSQSYRKRPLSPQSKSSSKVTSVPGKATDTAPAGTKSGKASTLSRREELLKQLKAVEDAIARKRAKIPGKV